MFRHDLRVLRPAGMKLDQVAAESRVLDVVAQAAHNTAAVNHTVLLWGRVYEVSPRR